MAILNWKETLIRILEGVINLPDSDECSNNELNSLLRDLKLDESPDLKKYKDLFRRGGR